MYMYKYTYNVHIHDYMYNAHTHAILILKASIGAKEPSECGQTLHTHTYTPKLSSRERYS